VRRISKIVVMALVLCFMFTSVAAAASGDIFIGNKQFTIQQLLTRAYQPNIDQAVNAATTGGQNILDVVTIDYGTGVYSLRSVATASQAVVNGTSPDFRTALTGQPTTTPPANPEPGIVDEQPVAVVVTATNPSATGFTLNFDKAVTGLVAGDIVVKKGADIVTCDKAVAADEKSVAVSGTFAAGEYTVTITKAGFSFNSVSVTVEEQAGATGTWQAVVPFEGAATKDFTVSVQNLDANHFELYATSGSNTNIVGSRQAIIGGKVTSAGMVFSNPSALSIKFYNSATATKPVATAVCAQGGVMTITLAEAPVAPTGTWQAVVPFEGAATKDFTVSVQNLDAAHFELYATSASNTNMVGSRQAIIGGKVTSAGMVFSNPSALSIKFYNSATATTPVATAVCAAGGEMTITLTN
jgi:uncharacterized protein YfiM (DUF2279 family)